MKTYPHSVFFGMFKLYNEAPEILCWTCLPLKHIDLHTVAIYVISLHNICMLSFTGIDFKY